MKVFAERSAPVPARQVPAPAPAPATPEARLLREVVRHGRLRRQLWWCVRGLGALSLLAVGAVHLQQYLYLYSAIPTVGTLFLLNFAGATAIGLGLALPVERALGRFGGAAVALLSAGGAGLAATAFAFLLVSERTPLFGFMEPGYDPPALMAARASELATAGLLGAFLAGRVARRMRVGRW